MSSGKSGLLSRRRRKTTKRRSESFYFLNIFLLKIRVLERTMKIDNRYITGQDDIHAAAEAIDAAKQECIDTKVIIYLDDEAALLGVIARLMPIILQDPAAEPGDKAYSLILLKETHLLVPTLEHISPDVLMSDYVMPYMNGREAIRLTRQMRPSAKIILTSSTYSPEEDECDRFLAKPYVRKTIAEALLPLLALQGDIRPNL
jgi:CheY-like chemotaxis protein